MLSSHLHPGESRGGRGCDGTEWIDLGQERERWWALVNTVMWVT